MELKKIALERALAMLKSADCKFVVVQPDGTEHTFGDLRVAPPEPEKKRTRTANGRVYGELVQYYRPMIKDLKPNECVIVPFGKYTQAQDKDSLQGGIASTCGQLFGHGNFMTHMNSQGVEVLRLL